MPSPKLPPLPPPPVCPLPVPGAPFVAVTGVFDGVHIGHTALLQAARELARQTAESDIPNCQLSHAPSLAGMGSGS